MKPDRKHIYRLLSLLFVVSVFISACGNENSNPPQSSTGTQKTLALSADHPVHYVSTAVDCEGLTPCYSGIQAAINEASAGEKVLVLAGTYNESITLKSGVTVQGAGAQATTIDATGKGTAVIAYYLNPMNPEQETKIDGFTIKNGSNWYGGGMYIINSSITVTNLIITGNKAQYGGGIYNYYLSSPVISNTLIYGNNATNGGGIYNGGMSSPTISNATIAGNTASGSLAGGIRSDLNAVLTIKNSIIASNFGVGISGTVISDYNDAWGNTMGDYAPGVNRGTFDLYHALPVDPMAVFVNAANNDYRLQTGSHCIDVGSNNAVPTEYTTDIFGASRIVDGNRDGTAVVDMGAIEHQLPVIVPDQSTLTGKAGQAVVIKFGMRVDVAIDPLQPFVHNEGLEIKIYKTDNPGVILQTSHFGFEATDYRIDEIGQFYIISYKTDKNLAVYTLEIWDAGLFIGKFSFIAAKK